MSGSAHDDATLRFYAGEAGAYAKYADHAVTPELEAFLARLRPRSEVLELGCGTGRDAAAMIARGFDVTPTDGVPEMAREAQARIGRPVKAMRFDELDEVERYDAVWANACLLHVPMAELPAILARVRRALRPGGLFFANFKTGEGEGRDRLGRYYNFPSAAQLKDAYEPSGPWEKLAQEEGSGTGYEGSVFHWLALTVRKL